MANRKDKAAEEPQPGNAPEPVEGEPQVVLEQAGPTVPVLKDGGEGEVDEKVNPAQEELQARVDEAEAQGYYGVKADPTPDHHYSVSGQLAGKPTPETDRGNA